MLASTDRRRQFRVHRVRRLAVPATLNASLMARLDRLGAATKQVAQFAAAIGREFSYELLVIVCAKRPGRGCKLACAAD